MKVVITGGMGFVGNEIAREISKAFEKISILAVGRTKNPPARKFLDGMKYIACDLSTKNNYYSWLEGADTVFHVAAKAGVGTNLKEYYDANYLATNTYLTPVDPWVSNASSTPVAPALLLTKRAFKAVTNLYLTLQIQITPMHTQKH